MNIIFFGKHSNDWMNVLNSKLITDFSKHTNANIREITNVYDINKLTNMDLSSTYIIPLMENHMIDLHNKNIKGLMPSIENIKMFSCKKKFASYVKHNNLEQYTPKVYESFDEINTDNNGMYIIKPYNLSNGEKMKITKIVEKSDFENNIVQEYIENIIEYTTYAVSKNGKIIKHITYGCNFGSPCHIKRHPVNTTNMSRVDLDDKYITQLESFLHNCGYTGISNTDFIICDGKIKVFEINPRLGGGLVRIDRCDLVEMLYEAIKQQDLSSYSVNTRVYDIFIDNRNYNYHFEVIESVLQKYNEILHTSILPKDVIFYLSIEQNPSFKSYILTKYANIQFSIPDEYDYSISITINDIDYDDIVKNSNKEFYISHQITNRLEVLSNVWFLTPLAKQNIVADILPYSDQKKRSNIPIYIVQGNLNQGRRNLQLLKNILDVDYKLPFVIKMVGRGVLPLELEEYKDKIVLRNDLEFIEYHQEFLDAYCILPLITKSTHPQYYTSKLTSTINYARGYKMKCLIDQDLQNIYHLSDVEVFMHEKDIVRAFQKTLHDFYKIPIFTEN